MIEPAKIRAWKIALRGVVSSFADEVFQRRIFDGVGPEISSLREMYEDLFGSLALREYLERTDIGVSEECVNIGRNLVARLDDFKIKYKVFTDIPKLEMLETNDWKEIRTLAVDFEKTLRI